MQLKWLTSSTLSTTALNLKVESFMCIAFINELVDLLVPVSSGVMHGLKNTIHSRFPGTSFEENEELVRAIIPLVALFTWIGTPQCKLVMISGAICSYNACVQH